MVAKKDGSLNDRQQLFVDMYLAHPDMTASECVIKAGYKTKYPDKIAYAMKQNPKIDAAIRKAMDKRAKRMDITKDRVLQEFARLAFFDPRMLYRDDGSPIPIGELDDDTAAAVAGLDIQEVFEGFGEDRKFVGYTKKYKISDKVRALEGLAKHLGMFTEKIEHSGSVVFIKGEDDLED